MLHLSVLGDGLNIWHLHLWFEWSHHCVWVIDEFTKIDISEVTWWTVSSWTWRLEPLSPSWSATDTEWWRFCAVEVSWNVLSFAYFAKLLMGTWARILIDRHLWSEEPVMWRRPLLSLWVRELRVQIIYSRSIHAQCQGVFISASAWNSFSLSSTAIIWNWAVCNLSLQLKRFWADSKWMLRIVSTWARSLWIRLMQSFIIS